MLKTPYLCQTCGAPCSRTSFHYCENCENIQARDRDENLPDGFHLLFDDRLEDGFDLLAQSGDMD